MARFERSKGRERNFRDDSPRRDFRPKRSFENSSGRDYSSRNFSDKRERRHEVEMTKVVCSSCGAECEVPFKPSTNKPVYCTNCFAKKERNSSNDISNNDLKIINEKLDKILRALKTE